MHLDLETLERLRHGELPRPTETLAREHLARCAACQARSAQAEREESEVFALLRQVDEPPPAMSVDRVLERTEERHGSGLVRIAAGVLLVLGLAGVSYAVPGSPVRAWLDAAVEWIAAPGQDPRVPEPGAAASDAGIAVVPGERLVIAFTSPQATGRAEIEWTDEPVVEVRAPLGAATFTSEADRLLVDNRGESAVFEIRIPRGAPRVEIQVAGRQVLLKDGPRITGGAPAASGRLEVSLASPGG